MFELGKKGVAAMVVLTLALASIGTAAANSVNSARETGKETHDVDNFDEKLTEFNHELTKVQSMTNALPENSLERQAAQEKVDLAIQRRDRRPDHCPSDFARGERDT
jgi:hypothetical protein